MFPMFRQRMFQERKEQHPLTRAKRRSSKNLEERRIRFSRSWKQERDTQWQYRGANFYIAGD